MNRRIVLLQVAVATTIVASLLCCSWSSAEAAAISCGEVNKGLAPCIGFIKDKAPEPSAACCSGAKGVADKAQSPADQKTACECVQKALAIVGTYDKNSIPMISQKCGIPFSFPPIDANTKC